MWGLEWKTLFANEENDNYLSPKIGLSLMDIFNVEYAYNVLNTNNDIQINSKHQIGININLNKKLYTYIFKE
jgi:TATA-binding protein-associated factor Taf7